MDTKNTPEIVPALGFAGLTPFYDAVMAVTMREQVFRPALVHQARIGPGHEVLDLACGTGSLAVMICARQRSSRVTGLDADPEVLAIAGRKADAAGATVRFDQGLSSRLPYPDESFDRVVSSLLFHHLSSRDKAETAAEALRVLRPGGELHVADWGRPTNPVMRAMFVFVQLLDGFANTRENVAGKLPSYFVDAGFEGVRQSDAFSTVFGTLALYRAVKPTGASAPGHPVNQPSRERPGAVAAS